MKKIFSAVFVFLGVMLALYSWYDEQLFTSKSTTQIPFIMIMMDTSASMNQTVFYPLNGVSGTALNTGYDMTITYPGTIDFKTFGTSLFSGDEVEVDHYTGWLDSNSIEHGGFYFGWRVLNTTSSKTINGANYLGQVIADSGSTIEVNQNTYNNADVNYWIVGKTSGAYAKISQKVYIDHGSHHHYTFNIISKGGTYPDNNLIFAAGEPLFLIQALAANGVLKRGYFYSYPAANSEGSKVRYTANYLKWLLLRATYSETSPYGQLQETSYFHKYSTFDTNVVSPNRPGADKASNCSCSSIQNRKIVTVTRIQAGREAMCKIANVNWNKIVLGVFKFRTDYSGGEVVENLNNNPAPEVVLKSIYNNTPADTNTPLAGALADLWAYWRPQGSSQATYWPTGWGTDGKYHGYSPTVSTAGWGPPGLGATECTHFYNILVTDGQSSQDTFWATRFNNSIFKSSASKIRRSGELSSKWNYANGWGDYDNRDPYASSADYCPVAGNCWAANGTDYVDDVAYLMYHSDMCPNERPAGYETVGRADLYPKFPGDQNIVTHVVGFNMVNDMLKETATNGGGQFYTSNNYEDLSAQLQAAIDMIYLREAEMMYNVFASPKQAVTASSDLFGFKGTFVPQTKNSFWEGHLKCFKLTAAGEFPANEVDTEWDAFDKMKSQTAASRNIYTFKYVSGHLNDASNAFTSANIVPTDLGLALTDTTTRDSVVTFIRGDNGFEYKLGDIFHFNPIIVGSPLIWKGQFDASYQAFYTAHLNRKEVVYVGTNDGMLHCIRVRKNDDVKQGGEELWGFVPPSQLHRVKNLYVKSAFDLLKNVPPYCSVIPGTVPCSLYAFDRYFVDGKGMATDIKIGTEWKTVLIFGMGIGGTSYCALDVTDPDDPKFLWEFTDSAWMGYTEARPIISQVNDGTATYSAVFVPGGYDYWERPAKVDPDPAYKLGKALFVLKAEPGMNFSAQVVKKFVWNASTTGEAAKVGDTYTYTSMNFKYSFVAAPAIYDRNSDGVADYIYACDTGDYRSGQAGGRIWKIPVHGVPTSWIPEEIFQAPNSQTLFISPTIGYDASWNLWVFVGTGRRSQITSHIEPGYSCTKIDPVTGLPYTTMCYDFTNLNGRFYAFQDKASNPKPLDGTSATYFKNITSLFGATAPSESDQKLLSSQIGIYFDYFRGLDLYNPNHEVIFEPTPIFVNNTLTMNTYAPTAAEGTVGCGASAGFSGKHSIYQFTLGKLGAASAITFTNSFGGKILGSGVLSSGEYIVYIGAETVGTFTATNYYRPSLADTFGPIIWKEDKR
jgi:hypothetical protein